MSAVAVVSRGDLALNPAILQTLQQILGAHVITFGPDGEVIAVSGSVQGREELVAAAARAIASPTDPSPAGPVALPMDCGVPCLVVYRAVEGRPNTVVALVAETSELAAATSAVARAILLATALSVIVMVLVSQAVVRRVTGPLNRLVQFARGLAPDESERRAEVGNDESGALAEAFNGMLDRLQRSQDALVRSEKLALAGLFAARVAHDIRNPLSSIKMQTQLLRGQRAGSAEDEATLDAVLHDISQVESVISDLLEVARPGTLTLEPMSVNVVIREALDHLRAQFSHRHIAVEVDLADPLAPVLLDPARFKQVLLNVLVNAAEAMITGGRLEVQSRAAEGGAVSIEICDDGLGVEPAVLDRVFDPFVSTKRDGIGLGLVNAKAVVDGHGGRISLQPRRPKGTCVTIWLPGQGADAARVPARTA